MAVVIPCRVCGDREATRVGAPVCLECRELAGAEPMAELDRVFLAKAPELGGPDAYTQARAEAMAKVRQAVAEALNGV